MQDQNILERNKALVRTYYDECWSRGSVDQLAKLVTSDCRLHDPVFPSLGPGIDSLRKHITSCRAGFPDLKFNIGDVIAEKDEVVVHWTARGTQQGAFLGIQPTQKAVSVSGTSIHRIKGDRIAEMYSDWNLMTLLE